MSRLDSGKLSEALTQLERELSALWAPEEGAPPKARVCMGNLVVLTSDTSRAQAVSMIDALTSADTARTFLVTIDPKLPLWGLDASVSARCQRDGDQLLCSERIDLALGAGAVGRAASVITSLAVPEVPTSLVLLEPAPPVLVAALARESSRLVVDSEVLGLETVAELARTTQAHLTDLTWQRLYPWRSLIAAAFDDPRVRPAVSAIDQVSIASVATSTAALGPSALLLLGWLASRLGWRLSSRSSAVDGRHRAISLDLGLRLSPEAPPGALVAVELSALLGDAHLHLDLERQPQGPTLRSTRHVEGLGPTTERAPLTPPPLPLLLDRALQDPLADTTLRQALAPLAPPESSHAHAR